MNARFSTHHIRRGAQLSPILFALTFGAYAQSPGTTTDHSGHQMDMSSTSDTSTPHATGSTAEYQAAMTKMHQDMAVEYTGNPDVDFVRGMIPHHQGAVAMANTVLEYGTDPDLRALAEEVLRTQSAEIEWMEAWLAEHDEP